MLTISEKLQGYVARGREVHGREYSWVHCSNYFRRQSPDAIRADRDHAALQLGFYLASWGMYRGSSFLLQHAYTIHLGVIDRLTAPESATLWSEEFGANEDSGLVHAILYLYEGIRSAYSPFKPTDTLVTKVLLGTVGCSPALDTYFALGWKHSEFGVPCRMDSVFLEHALRFCRANILELQAQQAAIEQAQGLRYPLMKLVDMYFHEIGVELDMARR